MKPITLTVRELKRPGARGQDRAVDHRFVITVDPATLEAEIRHERAAGVTRDRSALMHVGDMPTLVNLRLHVELAP
jgi:hypothetical protein